eukprot:COSAG05_NODE_1181_length_5596_cov_3.093687_6_plen_192_part_00
MAEERVTRAETTSESRVERRAEEKSANAIAKVCPRSVSTCLLSSSWQLLPCRCVRRHCSIHDSCSSGVAVRGYLWCVGRGRGWRAGGGGSRARRRRGEPTGERLDPRRGAGGAGGGAGALRPLAGGDPPRAGAGALPRCRRTFFPCADAIPQNHHGGYALEPFESTGKHHTFQNLFGKHCREIQNRWKDSE